MYNGSHSRISVKEYKFILFFFATISMVSLLVAALAYFNTGRLPTPSAVIGPLITLTLLFLFSQGHAAFRFLLGVSAILTTIIGIYLLYYATVKYGALIETVLLTFVTGGAAISAYLLFFSTELKQYLAHCKATRSAAAERYMQSLEDETNGDGSPNQGSPDDSQSRPEA